MSHIFDNKVRSATASNPVQLLLTVGAGVTLMHLGIIVGGALGREATPPQCAGRVFTQIGSVMTALETNCEGWYLTDPPSAGAYTISIANANSRAIYATVSTYKASAGLTTVWHADKCIATSGANPTLQVAVMPGGVAVDIMGGGNNSAPASNSYTLLFKVDNGNYSDCSQYTLPASTGTATFTWTNASDDWSMCVASFKEAEPSKNISIDNASHGHTAESVTITQNTITEVVPNNASHAHSSESPTLKTGNVFSQDVHCKGLWKFESGALTTDSKGGNTLTQNGSPATDTANYREGLACVDLESSAGTNEYFYRADADLDAGFPLKSGDTNKKISVTAWVMLESLPSAGSDRTILAKYDSGTANKRSFLFSLYNNGGNVFASLALGYNSGSSVESHDHATALSLATWYHITATYQDSDKGYSIRVRDASGNVVGTDLTGTANLDANKLNVEDGPLSIGVLSNAGAFTAFYFDGLIDEVVVFDDILTAQEATDISLGRYGVIEFIPNNASHGHTAGSPAITQDAGEVKDVIPVNANHAHAAEEVIVSTLNVNADNAVHGHTAEVITITKEGEKEVVVVNAAHGHTAESLTLYQIPVVSPNAATHDHAASEPVVNQGEPPKDVTIDDSSHTHLSGEPVLTVDDITVDPLFRGHIRRGRYKRYIEPEVQNALDSKSQDEVSLQAARIAREEIEQDRKSAQIKTTLQELKSVEKKIKELQAKSLYVQRQAEILKELLEIQKRKLEDEEDIAAILMLL